MDNTGRIFVDHVEHDLLEAKRLLQSGLEHALECVESTAKNASTVMTAETIARLRALEDLSEESIDVIEKHLGELNYLAIEGRIKCSDDFDHLARPLSEALHDARIVLTKLDEISVRELGSTAGSVAEAWRSLHLALDAARLELALARKDSEEEADKVRQNLNSRFEEALRIAETKDAKSLGEKLQDAALFLVAHFGDSFKILFGFSR